MNQGKKLIVLADELSLLPRKAAGDGCWGQSVLATELCSLPDKPAGEPGTTLANLPRA